MGDVMGENAARAALDKCREQLGLANVDKLELEALLCEALRLLEALNRGMRERDWFALHAYLARPEVKALLEKLDA